MYQFLRVIQKLGKTSFINGTLSVTNSARISPRRTSYLILLFYLFVELLKSLSFPKLMAKLRSTGFGFQLTQTIGRFASNFSCLFTKIEECIESKLSSDKCNKHLPVTALSTTTVKYIFRFGNSTPTASVRLWSTVNMKLKFYYP